MTDGGALPIDFSRTVAGLREAGWLEASITVGQAFGGDLEAVNVHTGLLAAHHVVGADVVVVVPGTGQPRHGHALGLLGHLGRRGRQRRRDARRPARLLAADLGGRPARAAPRRLAPQPDGIRPGGARARRRAGPLLPGSVGARVPSQARALAAASGGRLTLHEVETDGLDVALRDVPVPLRTMGRGYDDDRAGFLGAAVAGRHVARMLLAGR